MYISQTNITLHYCNFNINMHLIYLLSYKLGKINLNCFHCFPTEILFKCLSLPIVHSKVISPQIMNLYLRYNT